MSFKSTRNIPYFVEAHPTKKRKNRMVFIQFLVVDCIGLMIEVFVEQKRILVFFVHNFPQIGLLTQKIQIFFLSSL